MCPYEVSYACVCIVHIRRSMYNLVSMCIFACMNMYIP
jgi:hypothetical protein